MLFHRSSPAASPSAKARAVLLASLAALVVTTFDTHAAPVARSSTTAPGQTLMTPDSSEFGSRRRARRGDAAALAMMGMMVGTIGAVIAAEQRRDAYRHVYYDYPYGYRSRPRVYRHPYAYEPRRRYQRPRVYHQRRTYAPNPAWHDRRQRIDPQNPNSANPTGVPRIGW